MTHRPDAKSREIARTLSGLGVPQHYICRLIGISEPTLVAHYREELDLGQAEAGAKIAETLYNQAIGGNTTALLFWAKCRLGWRETTHIQNDTAITIRWADAEQPEIDGMLVEPLAIEGETIN